MHFGDPATTGHMGHHLGHMPHARRPIRVAHLVPTLSLGGVTTHITHIVDLMGPRIEHVIVPLFSIPDRPAASVTGASVLPQDFSLLDIVEGEHIITTLASALQQLCIDIVHSHHVYSDVFALPAAARASCRGLRTVHGILQVSPDDTFRKTAVRHSWSQDEIQRELAAEPASARTICVSKHTQEQVVGYGIPAHKTTVIHNGVDIKRFAPTPPLEREEFRRRLGLPAKGLLIGFLGRLEASKNPFFVLEVASILRARTTPPMHFLVQGSGPAQGLMAGHVHSASLSETVFLHPASTDVATFFSAIDIALVPSLSEGCPYVVLEAMASGLPVLAARVGGIPELIDDGVTGLLFPPSDVTAAADLLLELEDPSRRHQFGAMARGHVASHFLAHRQVELIEREYMAIAGHVNQ